MNKFAEKVLPARLVERVAFNRQMKAWRKRGYLEYAPQLVKENIFSKYGIPDAPWIETGTYYGTTTEYLAKKYPAVYSIEPSEQLYKLALKKFNNRNVELFNDVSEVVLPELLPRLSGNLNFWLDGHFSAGKTFQGQNNCPVEEELKAISDNMSNFDNIVVLIDDVRCFLPSNTAYPDYLSIDWLVDWARSKQFDWRVEQDILVIGNLLQK